MQKLVNGDKAPDFSLGDQNGNAVGLGEFRGKKLFLPKNTVPEALKALGG